MNQHHVIVGAGPTGSATAQLLASRGELVRILSRSGSGPEHHNIERLSVDAADAAALISATADARVVYNCANPAYDRWEQDWPPVAHALLAAAEEHDAVLVTLSNLYGYAPGSSPMCAGDTLDPPTRNGAVRVAMWEQARAAHVAGRVRVTEARASDFIGPGLRNGHLADRVVQRVLKGKPVRVLGDPDMAHSWTAIDDVARTLVALGSDQRALGRAWHVPTAPPRTQREMIHAMCELAGREPVKVSSIPNVVLKLAGLFVAPLRVLATMRYQFDEPFIIDSSETSDVFGIESTSIEETLTATMAAPEGGDRQLASAGSQAL